MMRSLEINRWLEWRWASCVALIVGACAFVAVALLVIPERIGELAPSDAVSSGPAATVGRLTTSRAAARPAPDPIHAPSLPREQRRPVAAPAGPRPELAEAAVAEPAEASPPMPTSMPIGPVRPEDD